MLACHQTMFCGMWEFSGISDYETPEEAFRAMKPYLLDLGAKKRPIPFVMFTGTCGTPTNLGHCNGREGDYAGDLAKYIEENGLGEVLQTDIIRNWSGNETKVCIWQIKDHRNLWKFLENLE